MAPLARRKRARPRRTCPIRVQPALSSPKHQATTGPRHCWNDRYAGSGRGHCDDMLQIQVGWQAGDTLSRVCAFPILYKNLCVLNKPSLLRMLRNMGGFSIWGLTGSMLLATGKNTGTPPVHSHPLGQPIISISQPPFVTDHFSSTILSLTGPRISSSPAKGRTSTIHPTPGERLLGHWCCIHRPR
jgi:hypothetical protein